ncbi:MAG: hypothetical protein RLZZ602_797, partial [Pseudomonadota bacterium]
SHDIALSPFPFGNASSLADCLILGIPTVVLDGDEPHSRTDRCVYNAANIDTKLIGQSVDEYINAAVALIDSTIFRTAEREKIQQAAIYDIYKNNDKPFAMEFCKALRWAQANVDLLAKARGKVYYAKDCWGKE